MAVGERNAWLAGGAVLVTMFVVGWVDLSRTSDRALSAARAGDFAEVRQLDDDFDRRAWIYGGIAAVAMGLAVAGALARAADQRRVFSRAGVIGVLLGLAGVVVYLLNTAGGVDPPGGALLAPSLLLLAIAAIGGTATRFQRPGSDPEGVRPQPLRGVAIAAVTCTALTVALACGYAGQQDGSCDTPTVHSTWTAFTGWGAVITAAAACILGLAGLAARRWFVALVCVFVNPVALLYMVASTGALC